ncbi:unnamed protein product [Gordionus sp. m RMFG-2023]
MFRASSYCSSNDHSSIEYKFPDPPNYQDKTDQNGAIKDGNINNGLAIKVERNHIIKADHLQIPTGVHRPDRRIGLVGNVTEGDDHVNNFDNFINKPILNQPRINILVDNELPKSYYNLVVKSNAQNIPDDTDNQHLKAPQFLTGDNKSNSSNLSGVMSDLPTTVSDVKFTENLDKFDSQIHKLFPGLAIYNKEYFRRKKISDSKTRKIFIKRASKGRNKLFKNKIGDDAANISSRSLNEVSQFEDMMAGSKNTGKRVRKKTVLEKAKEELQTDPDIIKELILGKRIGFYKFKGEIGSGNFSQVKLATHCLTNEKVAIKILDKTKLDQKTRKLLSREVFIMELLHHPNIIRIYEVIDSLTKINIIMEYASGGELYTKINREGRLGESTAKKLFSQILAAVEHLHEKCIVHRDIKAENIFFFSPENVKLGDFGFSTTCQKKQLLTTYCGSPLYAAPELFKDEGYIGTYVDLWALGILLYYMVTGKMPFTADTMSRLKRVITSGIYELPPSPPRSKDEGEDDEERASSNIYKSDETLNLNTAAQSQLTKADDGNKPPLSPDSSKKSKKISAFFQHLTKAQSAQSDNECGKHGVKKLTNGYVINGKKTSALANNVVENPLYCGYHTSYFKNSDITLTFECKYIIRGLLRTNPPNSRYSIDKMRSSPWLRGQIFPKALSPIRIIPPIEEDINDDAKNVDELDKSVLRGDKTETNAKVDSEFDEVKRELLALGITESHLKEALIRNTRNSIIGTYRILLHKVHKSQKPLKQIRSSATMPDVDSSKAQSPLKKNPLCFLIGSKSPSPLNDSVLPPSKFDNSPDQTKKSIIKNDENLEDTAKTNFLKRFLNPSEAKRIENTRNKVHPESRQENQLKETSKICVIL